MKFSDFTYNNVANYVEKQTHNTTNFKDFKKIQKQLNPNIKEKSMKFS